LDCLTLKRKPLPSFETSASVAHSKRSNLREDFSLKESKQFTYPATFVTHRMLQNTHKHRCC